MSQSPHTAPGSDKAPVVGYGFSEGVPRLLKELKISLIVSTYQAQRVLLLSPNDDRMFMLMRSLERPTGMALAGSTLAMVTRKQVWFFEQADISGPFPEDPRKHDLCFTPRSSHVTGDIHGHEAAWVKGKLVLVNTSFSCLCTLGGKTSFTPFWKPPFITALLPEDRCHLNGVAADAQGIRFVTALGESDKAEGWRENRLKGGVVIDVASGKSVITGLCMPHSPRLYSGRLWFLESGTGSLMVCDPAQGKVDQFIQLPGYLRGLSFHGRYAFVGLCRIRRDKETFGSVPIAASSNLICGVAIVDLEQRKLAGMIEFNKGIEELFDIQVLSGVSAPFMVGFEGEMIDRVVVLDEVHRKS